MRSRSVYPAFLALSVLSVVMFVLSIHAQTKVGASGAVDGSGCVTAGVEGGCLVLTDFKTKKIYNLLFETEKKPDVGTAISFKGTVHDGPTICMQGAAVDVTKWTQLKMKCPSAKSKANR